MSKIAIDVDGTVVEHMYPILGPSVPHAARVLKLLSDAGHELIVWTMRDEKPEPMATFGNCLEDARKWFQFNHINIVAWNDNAPGADFSQSRKVYAQIYIDDAALGCPLIPGEFGERPMVDWLAVERTLKTLGMLPL